MLGHLVNPILATTELPEAMPDPGDDLEGCLSVPGVVPDRAGAPVVVEATGYLSRCLQHATDHLVRRLYLQRLIGRNQRAARRMLETREWTVTGNSWLPALRS